MNELLKVRGKRQEAGKKKGKGGGAGWEGAIFGWREDNGKKRGMTPQMLEDSPSALESKIRVTDGYENDKIVFLPETPYRESSGQFRL